MIQFIIACTSILAIWLVNTVDPELRMYACIFGLVGQPFWFYTSYKNKQWGIFISCFFFAAAWINGLVIYWSNYGNS